jgi:glycosyltransferase involved in cell wall biosynthesis
VFVGNIIAHKGLHVALEALSTLGTGWRLRVAGSGPDEARCRLLAGRLGLGAQVEFLGRQSAQAVERILGDSDVLVLPSEMEGLPYVILEAMASSLPVVSSGVFGIPEAVVDGETGLLVPPRDPAALAAALARLIGNADLRARMGANARRRFEERFTLERQVRAMSFLYSGLVNGTRA